MLRRKCYDVTFHVPVYVEGRVHLHKDADDATTEFWEQDLYEVERVLKKAAEDAGFWLNVDTDSAEQADCSSTACDC